MNKKDELNKIIYFLEKYDRKGLEGCAYYELGNGLYIVMAASDIEQGINVAKIAFNCDDLQCDYDFDWHMPSFKDTGEVLYTEIPLFKHSRKYDAKVFYELYKAMVREIEKGNLIIN